MAKKAVQTKEESHTVVHMQIVQPISLRKEMLGTAISITEILRTYEEIKELREHKIQYLAKLKTIIGQLKRELNKIKLDEGPLAEKGIKVEAPKIQLRRIRSKTLPRMEKPKLVTHADKLDDEIESLKKKLASI